MIKRLDESKRYEYDNTIQRKINEIINYLNAEEKKRKKILDNLNDNSNDRERKELSRFIKNAIKTLGINDNSNDNRKEK